MRISQFLQIKEKAIDEMIETVKKLVENNICFGNAAAYLVWYRTKLCHKSFLQIGDIVLPWFEENLLRYLGDDSRSVFNTFVLCGKIFLAGKNDSRSVSLWVVVQNKFQRDI